MFPKDVFGATTIPTLFALTASFSRPPYFSSRSNHPLPSVVSQVMLVFDTVVAGIEIINCNSCKMQVVIVRRAVISIRNGVAA